MPVMSMAFDRWKLLGALPANWTLKAVALVIGRSEKPVMGRDSTAAASLYSASKKPTRVESAGAMI